jgi:hypothetical protein
MLTIRQAQLEVLSQVDVEKFEDWTLGHLQQFFPRQCAALGELRLRETIHYGIQRAGAYGFTSRREVCKFIDLMIVFGRDFDTDDRHPWAAQILDRRADSSARMKALFEAARKHLRQD